MVPKRIISAMTIKDYTVLFHSGYYVTLIIGKRMVRGWGNDEEI
jgi:hypothetical protein